MSDTFNEQRSGEIRGDVSHEILDGDSVFVSPTDALPGGMLTDVLSVAPFIRNVFSGPITISTGQTMLTYTPRFEENGSLFIEEGGTLFIL